MWENMLTEVQDRNGVHNAGWKAVLDQLHLRLTARGHSAAVIRTYESAAVHFALWTVGKQLHRSLITDEHIAAFVARHFAKCHCRIQGVRQHRMVHAALWHLKTVLDTGHYRPLKPQEKPSAIDAEVHRFDEHMRTVAGLQESTRRSRRRNLYKFLQELCGPGKVSMSSLTPGKVVAYMSKHARGVKPGTAKDVANGLRSYFRFLQLHGECDEGLILSVPSPVNPKLATVPQVLTDEEISRLLAAFDIKTAVGRRDYAITRCLFDLALRPLEVAKLRLEDIDWRKGTIRIAGNKCRRDDQLPLTPVLGKALAEYLHHVRGHTSGRFVFLHLRAPLGQPIARQTVSGVVRRAAIRAGSKKRSLRERCVKPQQHGCCVMGHRLKRWRMFSVTAIWTPRSSTPKWICHVSLLSPGHGRKEIGDEEGKSNDRSRP